MREVLKVLAQQAPVAVVSGRTVEDVRERVGVDGILYAGEHGFDLDGSLASRIDVPYPQGLEDALDGAEHMLRSTAKGIEGAWVERKRFSIVAHHREAGPKDEGTLERAVEDVLKQHAPLGGHRGREVFEIVPDVEWDKGQAVAGLLGVLDIDASTVPVYVGDDMTDEHAFQALPEDGIGVLVRSDPRPTAATYALDAPAQVRAFLENLTL